LQSCSCSDDDSNSDEGIHAWTASIRRGLQSHSALSNPSPQFSGRQLAVLFEIQNPARSVLALLAGAALSTQAIDLQFHVCSNFVLVFFLKQTQFQYLSMSHSLV
jgi:hypothetical protein